jgi:hypothetical protein
MEVRKECEVKGSFLFFIFEMRYSLRNGIFVRRNDNVEKRGRIAAGIPLVW